MNNPICPKCNSEKVVKDGNYKGYQGYRCKICKHKFRGGKYEPQKSEKIKKQMTFQELFENYKNLSALELKKRTNIFIKNDYILIRTKILNNLFLVDEGENKILIYVLIKFGEEGIKDLLNKYLEYIYAKNNIRVQYDIVFYMSKFLARNIKESWKIMYSFFIDSKNYAYNVKLCFEELFTYYLHYIKKENRHRKNVIRDTIDFYELFNVYELIEKKYTSDQSNLRYVLDLFYILDDNIFLNDLETEQDSAHLKIKNELRRYYLDH